MKTILVLGGNFAGYTAALELRRKLGNSAKIIVVSRNKDFVYIPGLIWVPFGRRKVKDISFDLHDALTRRGIQFYHGAVEKILPDQNQVQLSDGREFAYDYLVVATGAKFMWGSVPGLGPQANSHNIANPPDAEKTYAAFLEYLKDPGPVVVGATPKASCIGAAYEYLFNFAHQLKKHNARKGVKITWVTPEPFLGHFGIGGMPGAEPLLKGFLKMLNIDYRDNAAITEVRPDGVMLASGEFLPSKFTMLMPPFNGIDPVKNTPGLTDEAGFVKTNDGYQSTTYPNIFAAGLAVAVPNPFAGKTDVPIGVPKTGYPSDEQGKIVAENIIRLMRGETHLHEKKFGEIPGMCVMDAGDKEVVILSDHIMKPRKFQIMMPMPVDLGKIMLEKYFMWKNKNGMSFLP